MKSSTAANSALVPSVEPKICNWRMNRRRRSADGSSPVVAPQVTSRPPRTRARIAAGHTALPTFSMTTSTPRASVSAITRSTMMPPTSWIVSAAPSRRARSSFAASRDVTIVRAPIALAICIAASDTDPPIPKMRTVSPGFRRAFVLIILQAVSQATLTEAA